MSACVLAFSTCLHISRALPSNVDRLHRTTWQAFPLNVEMLASLSLKCGDAERLL
jgi:hypothetical protein